MERAEIIESPSCIGHEEVRTALAVLADISSPNVFPKRFSPQCRRQGPGDKHENYETNPKQKWESPLKIGHSCQMVAFAMQNKPKFERPPAVPRATAERGARSATPGGGCAPRAGERRQSPSTSLGRDAAARHPPQKIRSDAGNFCRVQATGKSPELAGWKACATSVRGAGDNLPLILSLKCCHGCSNN